MAWPCARLRSAVRIACVAYADSGSLAEVYSSSKLWLSVGLAAFAIAGAWPDRALAHYPHDVGFWVATSPDPLLPVLVTSLERIELDILGRTESGLDWEARVIGAQLEGASSSASLLTPTRLLLATNGRGLLTSEDRGDTFDAVDSVTDLRIARVVASPAVLQDGVAFAAGETSVWRTSDAGVTWEAVLSSSGIGFLEVDVSPQFAVDGRVCAQEGGTLWCSADGGDAWVAVSATVGGGLPVGRGGGSALGRRPRRGARGIDRRRMDLDAGAAGRRRRGDRGGTT